MDFYAVYDEYYDKVRKYILAYVKDEAVADDLVQETFTRVIEKSDSIGDPSKVSSWIFRVATNLCHDNYRAGRKCVSNEGLDSASCSDTGKVGTQKQFEQDEMSQCVQEKANFLPKSLKDVLILFDVMEFNHNEIADILGISVKNTKVRLHRARKKMKEILERECVFEKDERGVLTCAQKESQDNQP